MNPNPTDLSFTDQLTCLLTTTQQKTSSHCLVCFVSVFEAPLAAVVRASKRHLKPTDTRAKVSYVCKHGHQSDNSNNSLNDR